MTTDDAQSAAQPKTEPTALTGTPILDQAFDADSLYALRAAVAAHATQAGLPPGRADDLVIAVHELAANAGRHGAAPGRRPGHPALRLVRHRGHHHLRPRPARPALPPGPAEPKRLHHPDRHRPP